MLIDFYDLVCDSMPNKHKSYKEIYFPIVDKYPIKAKPIQKNYKSNIK